MQPDKRQGEQGKQEFTLQSFDQLVFLAKQNYQDHSSNVTKDGQKAYKFNTNRTAELG
ncbi:hypothetical protein [Zeaxanthinibacter enoshimensis]|uniref:Uncharacterized protein n=1 Tax=Zeaxanthinibacter enoshimensis TaxID=392009 RepID=A0A4R6TRE0_9FLAO|nr:hypothetical protein [Zeaxanthinibacter enoshimensis]TDQ32439.1 hypothetical protein CLV82_0267 [Zeaxanthinibacter enoshimensis]